MQHNGRELWLAFLACLAISLAYMFITLTLKEVPAASGLIGHSISILGFP
jgi:formate/nitrite transporter FocA (FNT family)